MCGVLKVTGKITVLRKHTWIPPTEISLSGRWVAQVRSLSDNKDMYWQKINRRKSFLVLKGKMESSGFCSSQIK